MIASIFCMDSIWAKCYTSVMFSQEMSGSESSQMLEEMAERYKQQEEQLLISF